MAVSQATVLLKCTVLTLLSYKGAFTHANPDVNAVGTVVAKFGRYKSFELRI